jgi:hypothetical protein
MYNQVVPIEAIQGLWELLGCATVIIASFWFWMFPAR